MKGGGVSEVIPQDQFRENSVLPVSIGRQLSHRISTI
jgi:hypothetical protein